MKHFLLTFCGTVPILFTFTACSCIHTSYSCSDWSSDPVYYVYLFQSVRKLELFNCKVRASAYKLQDSTCHAVYAFIYPIYAYDCQFLAFQCELFPEDHQSLSLIYQCDFFLEDHQSLSFQTHSLAVSFRSISLLLPANCPQITRDKLRGAHAQLPHWKWYYCGV